MNIDQAGVGADSAVAGATTEVLPAMPRATVRDTSGQTRCLLDAVSARIQQSEAGSLVRRTRQASTAQSFVPIRSDAGRAIQLTQAKMLITRDYPVLRTAAREAVRLAILNANVHLTDLDPDRTYFNIFGGGVGNHRTYNGWAHYEAPQQSVSLTDLQLHNFSPAFGYDPTSLDANTGIYTEGAGASHFDTRNEVRLLSSEVRQVIRDGDFYNDYYTSLEDFYARHRENLAMVAQANSLDQAQAGRRAVQRALAQGMALQDAQALGLSDHAMAMLGEAMGHTDVAVGERGTSAYVFDINGYASRDMSLLCASDGRVVLIMPGEVRALREYVDMAAMRADIATMASTAQGRQMLARHFSIDSRPGSIWYWGIDEWLDAFGKGQYPQHIANGMVPIEGCLFANQVERMRQVDLANVHHLVRSNSEIALQELIQAFGSFNSVLGNPLTQAVELGLDIWEIHEASSEQDRDYAVAAAWGSAVSLGLGLLLGRLLEAGAAAGGAGGTGGAGGAAGMPASGAGPAANEWFRKPARLSGGRIGYPMGPEDPPRLPAQMTGNQESVVASGTSSASMLSPTSSTSSPSMSSSSSSITLTRMETSTPELSSRSSSVAGVEGAGGVEGVEEGGNLVDIMVAANDHPESMVPYRNQMDLLERTDIPRLYRAVPSFVANNMAPELNGFISSVFFAVPPMLEEPVVVTSSTVEGARLYAGQAWRQGYVIYEIDARDLQAVSLQENMEDNAVGLSRHLKLPEHTVDEWKANGTVLDNLGERALAYNEVHLSNQALTPNRISIKEVNSGWGGGYSSASSEGGLSMEESGSSARSSGQEEGGQAI